MGVIKSVHVWAMKEKDLLAPLYYANYFNFHSLQYEQEMFRSPQEVLYLWGLSGV